MKNIKYDTQQCSKNLNIQALRAIAILMVIAQHYVYFLPSAHWYSSTFKYINYWAGVDIFLAISGYLMCKTLSRDIEVIGRGFETFYLFVVRRLFRLLPAVLFWGVLAIVIAYFIQPARGISPDKALVTFYTTILGYANIHFYHCFVNKMNCDPMNAVVWSLSLEWQLYALIASLMMLFAKRFYLAVFLLIVIVAQYLPVSINQGNGIGWWIRPHAFFLGAIIYLSEAKIKDIPLLFRWGLFIISIIVLITAPLLYNYHFVLPSVGIAGALMLIVFLKGGVGFSYETKVYKILDWIGDRSYSIYLCHVPLMHILRETFKHYFRGTWAYANPPLYFLIFVISLIIVSTLSYRFIEQPMIALGKNILNNKRYKREKLALS